MYTAVETGQLPRDSIQLTVTHKSKNINMYMYMMYGRKQHHATGWQPGDRNIKAAR